MFHILSIFKNGSPSEYLRPRNTCRAWQDRREGRLHLRWFAENLFLNEGARAWPAGALHSRPWRARSRRA